MDIEGQCIIENWVAMKVEEEKFMFKWQQKMYKNKKLW